MRSSGAIASLLICVDGLLLAIIVRLSQTGPIDFNGSSYLPACTMASPELRYTINFTTRGVYTVWLRGYAPNGAGDSVYIGMDETLPITLTGFAPGEWSWANSDASGGVVTIEIEEPGLHTFYLWQREDGLRLDQILITTDSGYSPGENEPPESEVR